MVVVVIIIMTPLSGRCVLPTPPRSSPHPHPLLGGPPGLVHHDAIEEHVHGLPQGQRAKSQSASWPTGTGTD